MELALYGEHGFYTGRAAVRPAGAATSSRRPEVGPLFGAVLARLLDAEWERLGRPDPFTVVDAGAGPGTLARAVLAARPACAGGACATSPSSGRRPNGRAHPADVESAVRRCPPDPIDGVVSPTSCSTTCRSASPCTTGLARGVRRRRRRRRRSSRCWRRCRRRRPCLPAGAPHGARAPLLDAAAAWVAIGPGRVRRGPVVVVDYARPTTAELAALPWR